MTYPWNAGEVLAAADLNAEFASKLPYSYGTATPSTTDSGFLWYDSNSTPAAPKFWDGAAFQALTSGKILQIVRATDGTARSTSSTSFVDASISVTITPNSTLNPVLLIWSFAARVDGAVGQATYGRYQITDSSNNAISGSESHRLGDSEDNRLSFAAQTLIAWATPSTTSAVTYKGRFRVESSASQVCRLSNTDSTGQLFAIEVSA